MVTGFNRWLHDRGDNYLDVRRKSVIGSIDTLTIVSGFAYRYDNVEILSGTRLQTGISMIYPSNNRARAYITVVSEGNERGATTLFFDLIPPVSGSPLQFLPITVPLSQFSGKRVSIAFGLETPNGIADAHWVGFAYPKLIVGR